MYQPPPHSDEDQDSLFGSPPPSPVRGRSPCQETFTTGREAYPMVDVPSAGVARKNVGTIALPGSHMSCAELPADLPASSLSLSRPSSSHISNVVSPTSAHTPVVKSRSSTRSATSGVSSAAGATSASTRKRRTPKSKSLTPVPPAPPIALPGPNEPTPPNFLRSQSSLLGIAGLVGCIKPAQLHTHCPHPIPVTQSRPHSPIRGSTPTHPIVLDDDQDPSHVGKRACDRTQMPQHLDDLDPETFRSNVMNSLTKEKNIFPVLESLVKLLGGEPRIPLTNLSPPFARPYGHGIFNGQPSSLVPPFSTPGSSIATPAAQPPKRRKLKHVPAGAADWDIPFPFAAGEGPEAYRDTWARDRAKQLVTQLLELVRNAAKRATIKTAKNGRKPKGRTRDRESQSSRSASVELCTSLNAEDTVTGPSMDTRTIGSPTPGSNKGMSADWEGVVEEDGSAAPCDYSAFEEWLSQLQQLLPSGTNTPTPESDWGTCMDSGRPQDILVPMQCNDALAVSHTIQDEAIDPALLAMSQQVGSVPLVPGDVPQVMDVSSTLPSLVHSPRTSLGSLTEPLTPLSEAFADIPTTHQDLVCDPLTHEPVEKDSRLPNRVQTWESFSCPTEPDEPPRITASQKGKARVDVRVASATLPASSQSSPSAVSTFKGTLDKQAILERARERRRQLVAEIERAKMEMWETTIENAVLVHFMRDGSLSS